VQCPVSPASDKGGQEEEEAAEEATVTSSGSKKKKLKKAKAKKIPDGIDAALKEGMRRSKNWQARGDVGDHHTFLSGTGETLGIWEPRFAP
jgi:hypothetical protein